MPEPSLYTQEGGNQSVNVFARVVKCQGRPHRAFKPEAAQDRLGAVMSGTYSDAFFVERLAHVFRAESVEDKRKHARFLARGSDKM